MPVLEDHVSGLAAAPRGYFVHTTSQPIGDSVMIETWATALYATALHVRWVLGDAGHQTPVADELRARLESDPTTTTGWAPSR